MHSKVLLLAWAAIWPLPPDASSNGTWNQDKRSVTTSETNLSTNNSFDGN
jgi:hypothetical protein